MTPAVGKIKQDSTCAFKKNKTSDANFIERENNINNITINKEKVKN